MNVYQEKSAPIGLNPIRAEMITKICKQKSIEAEEHDAQSDNNDE